MDSYVKRFFPHVNSAGVPFPRMTNLVFGTFITGMTRMNDGHIMMPQRFSMAQRMTAAGQLEGKVGGIYSSLDGLNDLFIGPGGNLDLKKVADVLKGTSGLQTATLTKHISIANSWRWTDNHVPLIFNLMRLSYLLKLQECNQGGLTVRLHDITDGGISADMDQWWPADYPATAAMESWPSSNGADLDAGDVPHAERLIAAVPDEERDCLDLRSLTEREIEIVLMMLGTWRRRSRARLDFEYPKLTGSVYYRADRTATNYEEWKEGTAGYTAPAMPTSSEVWATLRKYVNKNKLYDHFSTALFLFSFSAYQFAPNTVEAAIWYSFSWQIKMPMFCAVRGRYEVLTAGDPYYTSLRGLNEWNYFSSRLEKMHLLCMMVAQGFATGCAVRSLRRSFEGEVKDLKFTEGMFYQPGTFAAAAVAQAISGMFPMPGMLHAEFTGGVNFDREHDLIINLQDSDGGKFPARYHNIDWTPDDESDTEESEGGTMKVDQVKKLADLSKDDHQYKELSLRIEFLKLQVADIKAKRGENAVLTDEQMAALEDSYIVKASEEEESEDDDDSEDEEEDISPDRSGSNRMSLKWVPLPGVPTLLLPLKPFPYATPFEFDGVLSPDQGSITRQGYTLTPVECWRLVCLYQMYKYSLLTVFEGEAHGLLEFHAADNMYLSWPVMPDLGQQGYRFHIQRMEADYDVMNELPAVTGVGFKNFKLEYSALVKRRGGCTEEGRREDDVEEYGPVAAPPTSVKVNTTGARAVARYRSMIVHSGTGYTFSSIVTGGVIPSAEASNAPKIGWTPGRPAPAAAAADDTASTVSDVSGFSSMPSKWGDISTDSS